MRLSTEVVYKPITITLETQEEMELFLSIIDKIDSHRNSSTNSEFKITAAEYKVVMLISDWFTNLVGFRE